MLPNVLPLKAFVYQSLFLLMAIAIEATVLYQRLNDDARRSIPPKAGISPKQSVQYATITQLLTTVVGWLVFFSFLGSTDTLSTGSRVALINFIFFDKWTEETATILILVGFITFFASLALKHFGLLGLRWLVHGRQDLESRSPAPSEDEDPDRQLASSRVLRDPRKTPSQFQPQFSALLLANALVFSAILAVLILRLLIQNSFTAQ